MTDTIAVPTWFFLVLLGVFAIVIVNKLLMPSFRWFLRKKINRAINELNQHLNIKIRPFQLTKRQVLLDRLVHDAEVLEFIQQQSIEDDVPREVLLEKVHTYAREIVPSFNAYIYYRLGFWLSKKLAKLLYRVRVSVGEKDHLANVSKDATVVFVMNHRSNMDYILVSFLVAEKMAISYAVGEWARVWPIQGLIKSMGAYFVRRNSRNPLYRKVLERYIDMATREGVCQAVFPEGGLTKDGNIREPKLGFLDYMLRHFDHQRDRDVVFIPVGINYDRVLEDRTLLLSLSPGEERKSRWFAVKTTLQFIWNNFRLARKHQWKRFGYASVSFAESFSTSQYCNDKQVNFSELAADKRFSQISDLANELMKKVEYSIPVVPLVLIASVLVECKASKITLSLLKALCHEKIDFIESKGGHVVFPHKDKEIALDAAIERLALRKVVVRQDEEVILLDEHLELLEYYANSIRCWSNEKSHSANKRTLNEN